MRVKIGDTWYEPTPEIPICVELNQKDKENIANMPEGATRYGLFHDDTTMNVAERMAWMRDEEAPVSNIFPPRASTNPEGQPPQ